MGTAATRLCWYSSGDRGGCGALYPLGPCVRRGAHAQLDAQAGRSSLVYGLMARSVHSAVEEWGGSRALGFKVGRVYKCRLMDGGSARVGVQAIA